MSMFSPAEREVPMMLPSSSANTSRAGTVRRSSSTSITTGTSPSDAISSWGFIGGLVDQVDSVLAQLVGRGHHARVRLISTLIDNQVRELLRDVHGGRLHRSADDLPAAAGAWHADGWRRRPRT